MKTKTKFQKRGFAILTFLFLIIFSTSVIANSAWVTYGNSQARFAGLGALSNLFFGSNFVDGNINFTIINISQGSDITPIIADLSGNLQNELVLFSGSTVYMYDNNGNFINTVSLNGTVEGTAALIIDPFDNSKRMIVLATEEAANTWNINLLRIANDILTINRSYNICSGCPLVGEVLGNDDSAPFVYLPRAAKRVQIINLETETVTLSAQGSATSDQWIVYENGNFPTGGLTFGDIASGTQPKVIGAFCQNACTSTLDTRLDVYDPNTDTWSGLTTINGLTDLNMIGTMANIGNFVSQQEYIFASPVNAFIEVYDSAFTQDFAATSCGAFMSFPAVADVDTDGNNDICFICNDKFQCYNSLYEQIIVNNISGGGVDHNRYIALGHYDPSNDLMEVITNAGVWKMSSTPQADLEKVAETGATGRDMMILPVSLQRQAEFTKDIILVSDQLTVYMVASGTLAVCGDNICSPVETLFSCFQDCGIQGPPGNNTIGFFGYNQQCFQSSDCFGELICEAGFCSGKNFNELCTNNFECISGSCLESTGTCEKSDLQDAAKGLLFKWGIRGTGSKLIIGLFIMFLGLAVGAGALSKAGALGVFIGGTIGLIAAMFINAMLGLFGVWIIFVFFIMMVLTAFLALMAFLRSGGG